MIKVSFLVDGFNLYHSVRTAQYDLRKSTKWLNIRGLCESYLYKVASNFGERTELGNIYYFSALAEHLTAKNPNVTLRHKALLSCLEDTGIAIELNRFKPKMIRCPRCHGEFTKYEEKETDVSISIKLLEIATRGECEAAVLLTGDTDIAPAVRTTMRLFPKKSIIFAFPYKRKNRELSLLAPGSFTISSKQYVRHQFPDPYILMSGKKISKPASW